MFSRWCRRFVNNRDLKLSSRIIWQRFASGGSVGIQNGLFKFPLADIGEGIYEVQLVQWFIKEGQKIEEFDKVCEVMSDKANVDITSPKDGEIVKLHWKVGEMAKVGEPLCTIRVEGETEEAETAPAIEETEKVEQTFQSEPEQAKGLIQTTPAVRRIAKEHDVDLALVTATGPGGRILKEDVLRFLNLTPSTTSSSNTVPPGSSSRTPATPAAKPAASISMPQPPPATAEDKTIPVVGVKSFMVKKMNEANQVPQFGYGDEICMDRLIEIRKQLKPAAEACGVKISFLPFILKAISLSLLEYPILNSHVNSDCTEYYQRAAHNLGIAVDSPQGLVVPNIKNCESKSIFEIARDIDGLVGRVRDGKTTTADITGGTFTISNIGAIGGTVCRPIVFVPEVCIGALGKTQRIPTYDQAGNVVPKSLMHTSWSADHRIIDGATVARFSNKWKEYVENPETMLLHLR